MTYWPDFTIQYEPIYARHTVQTKIFIPKLPHQYVLVDFGRDKVLDREERVIMVHVLDNGLPCVCLNCVRERNEALTLNIDLVEAFRDKVKKTSSKPRPACHCHACVSYGHNGMEGCLYPDDPDYNRVESRAAGLLRELLTDEQWESWENLDYFPVMGSDKIIYRVYRMPTYNVLNTKDKIWYCTLPKSTRWGGGYTTYPPSDGRIAQMLFVQTDANGFMEVANRSEVCCHPSGWTPTDLILPKRVR